jgi:hypothetical protein
LAMNESVDNFDGEYRAFIKDIREKTCVASSKGRF